MFDKVLKYVKENHMIEAGDEILAGVSGGADSVCLFFLLQKMQEKLSFHFTVMHVNHCLRETANEDEEFVKNLCETYEVPFVNVKADVPALIKEKGLSVEEAARIARYEAFKKQADLLKKRTKKKVKLVVAHHENDQAETVLFHLFRGCSLTGLRGMKPVREEEDFILVRPMLCVSREKIEEFLEKQGITYVTDETNADNRYSRNRIRNQMIPIAEQSICQGTVGHIAETAKDIGMVEDFLDGICQQEYEKTVIEEEGMIKIRCKDFLQKHGYLKQELLYRAISRLAGVKKDIKRVHIESLSGLFDSQVGRKINLPYEICARKTYEWVELFLKESMEQMAEIGEKREIMLEIPGTTTLFKEFCINARIFPYDNTQEIPKKKYTKWFDYDKIKRCLVVRNRDGSDYFYIDDHHKKRVKDYMVNEKIDQVKRDKLFLICDDHHMVWMPGYRISAYYKVDDKTKKILELSYVGGTKDGGED